jgi:hypothetical protein
MTDDTVVLCGRGISAGLKVWDFNTPTMAVSCGYWEAGKIDHFCAMDAPHCFPKWLQESDNFDKHVPAGNHWPQWEVHPRTRAWAFGPGNTPDFLDPEVPCVQGEQMCHNHSLLFATQVASKMGYRRLIFLGVDLTSNELHQIDDTMHQWHPRALDQGIKWENASPLSLLQAWMPDCETKEALCIPQ